MMLFLAIIVTFTCAMPAMGEYIEIGDEDVNGINIVPVAKISDPVPRDLIPVPGERKMHFKPVHTRSILLGLSNQSFWVKFKLVNTTDLKRKVYISSSYPSIDYLDLYRVGHAGKLKKIQTIGDKVPYPESILPSRYPYFELNLPSGENLFYIKIHTQSSIQLTLRVWTERQFTWAFSKQNIICSLLFGSFAIIAIYNIMLYYSFRHPAFVLYVAYIVTNMVFLSGTQGYNYHLFAPNASTLMQNKGMLFFGLLAEILVIFYSMSFLNVRRHMPKLQILGWIPLVLGSVGIAVCFVNYGWAVKIVLINAVFTTIASIFWGVVSSLRRYRPAYYYTFAWSMFFAGSLYQAVGTLGIIDTGEITLWGQFVGFSLQVVFQSLALADKISFIKEQSIKKNEEAKNIMSQMNVVLERRVQEKTENIKLILENVSQGIFTISGTPPKIQSEFSKSLLMLFNGEDPSGKDPIEYLFANSDCSSDTLSIVRNVIEISLNESIFNFMSNENKLPRKLNISRGNEVKYYHVDWLPIVDGHDDISRILVSVRDETQELVAEALHRQSSHEFELIKELLEIPMEKWPSFIESCHNLIEDSFQRVNQEDLNIDTVSMLFINFHTLKGVARTFHLSHLVAEVHHTESYLAAIKRGEIPIDRDKLVEMVKLISTQFAEYRSLGEEKLGRKRDMSGFTTVEVGYLRQMLARLNRVDAHSLELKDAVIIEEVCESLGDICYVRLSALLKDIVQSSAKLAKKLGKLPPEFEFQDAGLYLKESCHHLLIAVFTHLIRNSLDHGIESAAERLEAGKTPKGRITIAMEEDNDGLKIILRDDGRGLQLEKIRSKGLKEAKIDPKTELTNEVVTNIIFSSGFSTAETVSDISGRGVGLEAVKNYLAMHQASIKLQIDDSEAMPQVGRSFASVISLGKEYYIRA
jgi:hypothetical protein